MVRKKKYYSIRPYKSWIKRRKEKTWSKIIYFSNVNHCLRITKHEVLIAIGKLSDHEEVDTRLFALVEAAFIVNGKTVTIRSPSEDIDIIMLFLFHKFDGISILIDNGVGKL